MTNSIGAIGNTPGIKKDSASTKNFEFKVFSKESVEKDLKDQIQNLITGKKYRTPTKLSALYLLDIKSFRAKCFEDEELSKLYLIYNGAYVDKLMNDAISTGKVNSQTETYLKDVVQAYTGAGFEQNINWVIDYDPSTIEIDIRKIELDQEQGIAQLIKENNDETNT